MGRTAKYTDQDILDAALTLIAQDGAHAATAVAIARHLGAPSGSIYHRYQSRDLILATLWIRTVRRFQHGFLTALDHPDHRRAARQAVAHTVEWATAHRDEAKILTLYRRQDLIAIWPDELGDALSSLNDDVKHAIVTFTVGHFGAATGEALSKARFALIDLPHAAARHAIHSDEPLPWLLDSVITAAMAVLDPGEAPA